MKPIAPTPKAFFASFNQFKDDARVGGQIAGTARKQIERKIGRSVVSNKNFLQNKNGKKFIK
jgi:hypothetical protein